MITIRAFNERDDAAARSISEACYRFGGTVGDFTEEQVKLSLHTRSTLEHIASLRTEGQAFVAELDGRVAGIVVFKGDVLQVLFVDPAMHGKGIGRALFQFAETALAKAGYSKFTLKTRPFAVPFYGEMGMDIDGFVQPSSGPLVGADLIVMVKNIGLKDKSR